eukprot:TRINITY_DN8968_c0_g1_i1.p1 TRINITY_DN8968_c0_g1~~TRINITY_DN8968_c0_g1_i1.p1  ORF type:complete len:436 (-),score=51.14 TRINITY_DN8968_c0_g1_i1:90-1397(-)
MAHAYCPADLHAGDEQAIKPLLTASKKLPTKVRITYLDHVKLICMCSVWWVHGLSYLVFCPEEDQYPTTGNPYIHHGWGWRVFVMLRKYNMSFFAICSGAVSYSDVTADRVSSAWTSLIMPCILIHVWFCIFWSFPATGKLSGLAGFFSTSEPWYMKTLFAWRLLLFCFGQLSDVTLLVATVAARVLYTTTSGSEPKNEILSHVLQDAPFFVLGHVLVRRKKLLEPYVEFLNKRSWLQVACFLAYVGLWVDALQFGTMANFDASLESWWPRTTVGLVSKDVYRILETLVLGFAATGWLPTGELPVISSTGKYSLYAYLLNYHGLFGALYLFKMFMPRWSETFWFTCWFMVLPLITMFFCSEAVRFVLWPIAQPSWFGKDPRTLSFRELTDVPMVKQLGFYQWAAAVVALHGVWVVAVSMMGARAPWLCQEASLFT